MGRELNNLRILISEKTEENVKLNLLKFQAID